MKGKLIFGSVGILFTFGLLFLLFTALPASAEPTPMATVTITASPTPSPSVTLWCGVLYVYSTEGGSVTTPGEGTFLCCPGATGPGYVDCFNVHLVAVAQAGYEFSHWSCECDGQYMPCYCGQCDIDDFYAADTYYHQCDLDEVVTAHFVLEGTTPTPTFTPYGVTPTVTCTPSPTPTVSATPTETVPPPPTSTTVPTTTPPPTPVICDDFNDNAIDTSLWVAIQTGSGPIVTESNQRLEIVFPAGSTDDPSYGLFGARYSSVCQLGGDFDMQVDYQLVNWPSENGVRIALGVEEAPLDFGADHAAVERNSFGSGEFSGWPREVYLTDFDDGVKGATATSDLLGKLRLVRTGTTLSGYYYSNGSWVLIHSGPVTGTEVFFTVSAWSHDFAFADQEVMIAFDNFCINQGELVCGPTPTPTPTATVTPPIPEPTLVPWDWSYSQRGTVTSSGECGTLEDYQMRLNLHYGSGTNSGSDIYLDGNCQADFDDVRFAEGEWLPLLDYWVEEVDAGVTATVWVEFDEISASGTDFYIYYGNPAAESASDGEATFIIFNDGSSIAGWSAYVGDGTNWEAVDGVVRYTSSGYGFGWDNLYCETSIGTDYYVAESKITAGDGNTSDIYQQGIGFAGDNPTARWIESGNAWGLRDPWGESYSEVLIEGEFDATEEHAYSFVKNGNDWELFVDGESKVNRSGAADVSQYTGMYVFTHTSGHWVEFDDFRVRNYCSPEPVFSWEEFNPDDWAYSQRGTVTSSAECGTLEDYQMRLVLHYGSGANSGSDIYLDGNCQADFDDVRFTKSDGTTPLDYWMEEVEAGVTATVWVEFDTISPSGTDFYIYYGNPSAVSATDGDATFPFFDDFEDGVIDTEKWTEIYEDGDFVREEDGVLKALGSTSGFGARACVWSKFIPSDMDVKVYYRMMMNNIQMSGDPFFDFVPGIRNIYYYPNKSYETDSTALVWKTGFVWGGLSQWQSLFAWTQFTGFEIPPLDGTYHDVVKWVDSAKTGYTIVDGLEQHITCTHPFDTSQAAYLRIRISGENVNTNDGCIADVFTDHVFARYYCDPEPTITVPVHTPTPTVSPTPTASPSCSPTVSPSPSVSPTPTTTEECNVFFDQPSYSVTEGDNFTVTINVSNVEYLVSGQFDLLYDPGILDPVFDLTEGVIYDPVNGDIDLNIDSNVVQSGRLRVVIDCQWAQKDPGGNGTGPSGDGYLTQIVFNATAAGSTELAFAGTLQLNQIVDWTIYQDYSYDETVLVWGANSTVTVSPIPTPIPTQVCDIYLNASTYAAVEDHTFSVRVNIDNVDYFVSGGFDVIYDPSVLNVWDVPANGVIHDPVNGDIEVDIAYGGIGGNWWDSGRLRLLLDCPWAQTIPGPPLFEGGNGTGPSGDGYVVELLFKGVGTGACNISLGDSPPQFRTQVNQIVGWTIYQDYSYDDAVLAWGPDSAVSVVQPGDADLDFDVDAADFSKVWNIVLEKSATTVGADADEDGDVDAADFTKVRNILLSH